MSAAPLPLRKKSSADPANLGLFAGAPVVRKPGRKHRGRAIHGDGADHKALGQAPFRSLNERDLRTLLGANPEIAHYAVEPHELRYYVPNAQGGFDPHDYTPDVVCRYRSGDVVVIDAKAEYFASRPGWRAKEPHIREAYAVDHGVSFIVIARLDILAQPRLSNCQILERHRYIVTDLVAVARVREVLLDLVKPTTLADVIGAAGFDDRPPACRAYTAVMNLVLWGEVRLDMSSPITPRSTLFEGDEA